MSTGGNLQHRSCSLSIETHGQGFYGLGRELERCLRQMRARAGLLSLFLAHTSASLCVQENAGPNVLLDLQSALQKLAPESGPYRHNSEGPGDIRLTSRR